MPTTTIKYFTLGGHLPDEARSINLMFFDFAHRLEDMLPDGPEKSAGMRKLLEAKDCFVRAKICTETENFEGTDTSINPHTDTMLP